MAEDAMPMDHHDRTRKAHLLGIYYDRLKGIDENNRSLTDFFFGVDAAILTLVLRVFRDSWQCMGLAAVGDLRLRFNFLFLVLLAALVPYLIFAVPSPWSFSPLTSLISGGIIAIIIICLPWAYLLGSLKPAVLKAVLRAPWAREV